MARKSSLRPVVATRDRILNAAMLRFSRSSYEETGLRDIASDVGVDVAYVHRCFGSKQILFAEAMRATIEAERMLLSSTDNLARTLTKRIFTRDPATADKVGSLDIAVRSLASPEATRILRDFVTKDVIDPLSRKLDDPAASRAILITAFLSGISILRTVLRVESLREPEGGELEKWIANVIQALMEQDFSAGIA